MQMPRVVGVLSLLKVSAAACRRRLRVLLLVRLSLQQMWQNLMELERVVTEWSAPVVALIEIDP